MESAPVDTQRDPVSGLLYLSVSGFHAIAVDQVNDATVKGAVSLFIRLRGSNPLDVGMLAFNDGVKFSAALVNHLAGISVMVSRLRAESALAKARAEVARYLELRRQGDDNLAKFAQPMRLGDSRAFKG